MFITISLLSEALNFPSFMIASLLGVSRTYDSYFKLELSMTQIIRAITHFGNLKSATPAARYTLRMLATGTLQFTKEGRVIIK